MTPSDKNTTPSAPVRQEQADPAEEVESGSTRAQSTSMRSSDVLLVLEETVDSTGIRLRTVSSVILKLKKWLWTSRLRKQYEVLRRISLLTW